MIDLIKDFFSKQTELVDAENDIKTAVAALLMEVVMADGVLTEEEDQLIRTQLCLQLQLEKQDIEPLFQQAENLQKESHSLHPFTRRINQEFSAEKRADLIKALWDAAFADGELDKHEEHRIRQIADLLYVPHSVFIRSKLVAKSSELKKD